MLRDNLPDLVFVVSSGIASAAASIDWDFCNNLQRLLAATLLAPRIDQAFPWWFGRLAARLHGNAMVGQDLE